MGTFKLTGVLRATDSEVTDFVGALDVMLTGEAPVSLKLALVPGGSSKATCLSDLGNATLEIVSSGAGGASAHLVLAVVGDDSQGQLLGSFTK